MQFGFRPITCSAKPKLHFLSANVNPLLLRRHQMQLREHHVRIGDAAGMGYVLKVIKF